MDGRLILAAEVAEGVCLAHVHTFFHARFSRSLSDTITLGCDPLNQDQNGHAHKYRYYPDGESWPISWRGYAWSLIRNKAGRDCSCRKTCYRN